MWIGAERLLVKDRLKGTARLMEDARYGDAWTVSLLALSRAAQSWW